MRKILAATAIALSFATPVHAQYFWGSGPGGGMGGGWNACSNCGMRAFGPGGGLYMGAAGATNGFGRGMRGWWGVPSANGYGTGGYGAGFGYGAANGLLRGVLGGGMFGGGLGGYGYGAGLGGMLGGLFMGGNYYPGAIYQRPGVPPGNYAYGAVRRGGGGSYGMPQYNQGGLGNPGPGYATSPGAYGGGAYYRQRINAGYVPQVQYLYSNQVRKPVCRNVRTYDELVGYMTTKVCY